MKWKSMNLWPIQCFVVELPPTLRYCFSSILVCGISCSPKKPDLKVFQEWLWMNLNSGAWSRLLKDFHRKDSPTWSSCRSCSKNSILMFLSIQWQEWLLSLFASKRKDSERWRQYLYLPIHQPGSSMPDTQANTFACKDSRNNKKVSVWD